MNYIWLLWDFAALLLIIYCVSHCAYRGFVRTLISFFSYALSAAMARVLCIPLAELLYDHVVEDILKLAITNQMEAQLAEGVAAAGVLLESIPKSLQRLMLESGNDMALAVFDGDIQAMVDTLVKDALREPVLSILQSILFFVCFSFFLWVLRRFGRIFNGFYKIPVFGTMNTFLGGVIGALESLLLLYFLAVAVHALVVATGGQLEWLNDNVIDQTFIFRRFYYFS